MCMFCAVVVFFFKQKTAYEMRISDWSSDVCSSDLRDRAQDGVERQEVPLRHDVRRRRQRVGRNVVVRMAHVVREIEHDRGEGDQEDAEAEGILGRVVGVEGILSCGPLRSMPSGLLEPNWCSAQMCRMNTATMMKGIR